ncbi:MAG: penicillin-binding transpeptidase domain-containing protein [Bacteroidota bacterium]
MNKSPFILSISIVIVSFSWKKDREVDLQKYFDEFGVKGSFVLYDLQEEQYTRYNPERCRKKFSPSSTFIIPNTLIVLEEGVMKDETSIIKWDGIKRPIKPWNQDLTLADALRTSCEPCNTKLADKVGLETYREYLKKLDYGNHKVSIHTDDPFYNEERKNAFWLIGDLKISQEGQIDFLKKLYQLKLPVSKKAMKITKNIFIDEKTDTYVLNGKTGWTNAALDGIDVGWYVGYIEIGTHVYFFATNIESKDPKDSFARARKEITMNILKGLEII